MTQIRLLVVMPASDDQRADEGQRADNAPPGEAFTEQVNAILRFEGGWRLTMNGMEYPGATEGDTEMTGAAGEPPVKKAIEVLNRAAVKPDREEGADDGDDDGNDAEMTGAQTEAAVLEFKVPEASDTVRARVEPEVVVEDGKQHIRIKVSDPSWVEATDVEDAGANAKEDAGAKEEEDAGAKAKEDAGAKEETNSKPEQTGSEATGSSA